jgi:hypothetical protein
MQVNEQWCITMGLWVLLFLGRFGEAWCELLEEGEKKKSLENLM